MRKPWVVITACAWSTCFSSCVVGSFEDKVVGAGPVQIIGWVKLSGEFLIYQDIESMSQQLRFPHCISGVFSNQYQMKNRSQYEGKLVTVTGKLFRYSELPDEDRPLLPRKMLSGSVVPNFCYGSNVLLIEKMKLASKSESRSD
jgi:hypothetical protein